MSKLYYAGLILLAIFEVMNVYFIMPLPGSQTSNSIDLAYFLYSFRWAFRLTFGLLVVTGGYFAFQKSARWIPIAALLPVLVIVYFFNFEMTADHMFLQPESVVLKTRSENTLSDSSIVIAVSLNGHAKAYPIRYIQYHHQVRDSISGKPIMVTYCNVCRTGRVFEPVVDGKPENFRLVGMDHFNAMFEDETTRSWWRQATGEAITGPHKGKALPEVESSQLTVGKFFHLHPFGQIMDEEQKSRDRYDTLGRFEKGKSQSHLTRTDTLSWNDKSWVVGVLIGNQAKAYDWNVLKSKRVIHDEIGSDPVVVALASDDQTFIAFGRDKNELFNLSADSLVGESRTLDFAGRQGDGSRAKIFKSYQEFWHSWKQFHPQTKVYE